MKKEIKWITPVRGLLAIWIVLFHYTFRFSELYDIHFTPVFDNGGKVGVSTFFIISGFLTRATLFRFYENKILWIVRKYLRLWWSYIVCTFVTLAFLITFGLEGRDNIAIIDVIKDLFMMPYISGYIEPATWYVRSLVQYYVIVFVLSQFNFFEKDISYYLIIFYFSISMFFPNFCIVKYANLFIGPVPLYVGMMLYQFIFYNKKINLLPIIWSILYLSYVIHPIIIPSLSLAAFLLSKYYDTTLTRIIRKNFLLSKMHEGLKIIGETSYSWYLLHQNIGFIILLNFVGFYDQQNWMPYITAIITFLLAYILEKGVIMRVNINKVISKYINHEI